MMVVPAVGNLFLGEILELVGRREEAIESLRRAEGMNQELGASDSYWLTRTREALAAPRTRLVLVLSPVMLRW